VEREGHGSNAGNGRNLIYQGGFCVISCTEFIPSYSELFKYIDECYGYSAVQDFWRYLFKPDGKGIPLINYIKKDGLKGAFAYWSETLKEEASDVTRWMNAKEGWIKGEMHYCPSKGRLLKLQEELGIEPYAHYCDHCDYYRAALNQVGLDWIYDFTKVDKAACSSIIFDPKVFTGKMSMDENTVMMEFKSGELEYFHPDFHSSMNMGVDYLAVTYGEAALADYLQRYTKAVYRKRMETIKQEGLAAIRDMILDTYEKEHAPEAVETVLENDALTVTVHWCPAVRHLRKTGREVSRWYSWTTSVVMETIAAECGFGFAMGAYDAETGKTSYTFFAK